MATELTKTGDVPRLGPAVDGREFSVVRRGYDRAEVKAYLTEVETNLRRLEQWAQRTAAKLASAEEKSQAIADINDAAVAVFEAKARILEQARLDAINIEAEAKDRARVEAEIVAAGVISEAREEARRIAETALAATTPADAESILAEARDEADRLVQDARAEADLLIEDARAQAARFPIVERAETPTVKSEPVVDQGIGSDMAGLMVEVGGIDVEREVGTGDEARPRDSWIGDPLFTDHDDATRRSRFQRTSAKLPTIGKNANEALGTIGRLRKTIRET
jgi:DivIVA domain-containing protein